MRALSVVAAKLAAYFTHAARARRAVELARERDEARRAAEAANRAKDEFLALVSHELKTPLELDPRVGRRPALADRRCRPRAARSTRSSATSGREAKLVDDILDLAFVARRTLRLDLRTVEPARLIKAAARGAAARGRAASRSGSSRTLDEADTPLVADPERISQVVSILVANAIRFTPTGGHVEVSLERAAGSSHGSASATGAATSGRDVLPHLFDRFRPAEFTTASTDALGIGLAIVKDIVELHGGRVRVESAAPDLERRSPSKFRMARRSRSERADGGRA